MNLALINIRQLVTVATGGRRVRTGPEMRDLGIIENAAVLVKGDTIDWVGPMESLGMGTLGEADVLDCMNKVVMPGFVDSHTHLVFAGSREEEFALRNSGVSYAEIAAQGGGILNTVSRLRETSKKELKKQARRHLSAMMRQGTTTVEIKSGYGLDRDNEIKMLEAINELGREEVTTVVPTLLAAHAVPPEYAGRGDAYLREVAVPLADYAGSKHLAEYCDVFCERGFFEIGECRALLQSATAAGLKVKLHADELAASGGAELAAEMGAVSADHLEHVSDAGIAALASAGVVATLLPGVSFFLHHQYAPARRLIDAGAPVAIATDFNPGSCMSYSMPLTMTIACTQMGMSPEEAITAATVNAAAALDRSREIGSIENGKKADLVVFDIPGYRYLPYHFGENHVEKIVKNGVVLEF